jgi:hypothetical protein
MGTVPFNALEAPRVKAGYRLFQCERAIMVSASVYYPGEWAQFTDDVLEDFFKGHPGIDFGTYFSLSPGDRDPLPAEEDYIVDRSQRSRPKSGRGKRGATRDSSASEIDALFE